MESLKSVLEDGTVIYRNELGQYHREDGPAIEKANGEKYYYINGKLHREGGPAVVRADGEYYYINGKTHREDGPAVVCASGHKEYWVNGKFYRDGVPDKVLDSKKFSTSIECGKVVCRNELGELHREDGPAVLCPNGDKEYWVNGKRHRKGGPAIEKANGDKYYYINGGWAGYCGSKWV